jgi:hypothetical protein
MLSRSFVSVLSFLVSYIAIFVDVHLVITCPPSWKGESNEDTKKTSHAREKTAASGKGMVVDRSAISP